MPQAWSLKRFTCDTIFRVRRTAKILVLLLVLAALPLRGYAAALKTLCEAHHAGAQAAHQQVHEHAAQHKHGPQGDDASHGSLAPLCSLCATCSVGAPLAPDSAHRVGAAIIVADRIPFLGRVQPGFVPDHLDRPPLAL